MSKNNPNVVQRVIEAIDKVIASIRSSLTKMGQKLDSSGKYVHPEIKAYELVYATTNYINEAPSHVRKDNIVDFARGSVLMMVGNRKYGADVIIGITRSGKCELYDVVGLDDSVKFDIKKADNSKGGNPQLGKSPENELSTNTRIAQNDSRVNQSLCTILKIIPISKNPSKPKKQKKHPTSDGNGQCLRKEHRWALIKQIKDCSFMM